MPNKVAESPAELESFDTICNLINSLLNSVPITPIIIVEGENDVEFLMRFCDENILIQKAPGAKPGVVKLINEFSGNPSVIGICDRDYDEIPQNEQIFYYDCCNLEMMILSDEVSRERIFRLAGNVELSTILNELMPRSVLRKYNSDNNKRLSLKFEAFKISEYHKEYIIDPGKAVDCEITAVDLKHQLTADDKKKINSEANKPYADDQLIDITQGHDFLELFSIYVNSYRKSRKRSRGYSAETVFPVLLVAFGKEEFRKTLLYGKIKGYSKQNDIYFLIDF
jgi:hypothetical protein